TILRGGQTAGLYREGYEGYGDLIRRVGEQAHQSLLLLTSREVPDGYERFDSSVARTFALAGVSRSEGQVILHDKALAGSEAAWGDLVDRYSGNPLALKLTSEFIREAYGGEIADFLREGEAILGEVRSVLDQQFGRLSAFEQEIMYWLVIEREPVASDDLRVTLLKPPSRRMLVEAIVNLRRRSLIERGEVGLTLQNVVMEYVTERLIAQVSNEIVSGSIHLLNTHALMKAQAKEYVRNSQVRLILAEVLEQLEQRLGSKAAVTARLTAILAQLRAEVQQEAAQWTPKPGYAAGNILNMLVHLGADLTGYDFSEQSVWQAYVQGVNLRKLNLSKAYILNSLFTETFGNVISVAFDHTGKYAAIGSSDGEIRIWDITDFRHTLTLRGHNNWVQGVAFSRDGCIIASGSSDHSVRLWDTNTGQCIKVVQERSRVYTIALNHDASMIATGNQDSTVRLWDTQTGACWLELRGHTGMVRSVAWTPDGSRLASGGQDDSIRVWDAHTGQCSTVLRAESGTVWSIVISTDGQMLASGSDDRIVRLWDLESGQLSTLLQGHTQRVWSVSFSYDHRLLASGSDDSTIRIWDLQTGQCVRILPDLVRSIAFSPRGSLLVSGSGGFRSVRLWNAQTGHCLKTLQGHTFPIWNIAVSAEGHLLASTGSDQIVRVWNWQTGSCESIFEGHDHWGRSVTFIPGKHILASCSDDQTIRSGYPRS
ncbi:MAG: hypothetical protein HGA65_17130, partial [Oscillochloris sp.]|nr:hypothetical protein [Oscillochloris sp.]